MAERTDERSREEFEGHLDDGMLDDDLSGSVGTAGDRTPAGGTRSGSRLDGVRSRVGTYLGVRRLLLAAVVLVVLGSVADAVVPLVGGPVGLFAGAFLLGLVDRTTYPEVGIAGGVLGAVGALLGNLPIAALTGALVPLAAAGAIAGAVAAVVGTYFGRDLRDGLTRDL